MPGFPDRRRRRFCSRDARGRPSDSDPTARGTGRPTALGFGGLAIRCWAARPGGRGSPRSGPKGRLGREHSHDYLTNFIFIQKHFLIIL